MPCHLIKSANLNPTTDAATNVPDNDPTFTMKVNRTTGAITGIFDHTDGSKPSYNAVILQKGANASARGSLSIRGRSTIGDGYVADFRYSMA